MRVYYKIQGVSEVAHRLISPGASNGGEEGRSINGRPPASRIWQGREIKSIGHSS